MAPYTQQDLARPEASHPNTRMGYGGKGEILILPHGKLAEVTLGGRLNHTDGPQPLGSALPETYGLRAWLRLTPYWMNLHIHMDATTPIKICATSRT